MKKTLFAILLGMAFPAFAGSLTDKIAIDYSGKMTEFAQRLSGSMGIPYVNLAPGKDGNVHVRQTRDRTVADALTQANRESPIKAGVYTGADGTATLIVYDPAKNRNFGDYFRGMAGQPAVVHAPPVIRDTPPPKPVKTAAPVKAPQPVATPAPKPTPKPEAATASVPEAEQPMPAYVSLPAVPDAQQPPPAPKPVMKPGKAVKPAVVAQDDLKRPPNYVGTSQETQKAAQTALAYQPLPPVSDEQLKTAQQQPKAAPLVMERNDAGVARITGKNGDLLIELKHKDGRKMGVQGQYKKVTRFHDKIVISAPKGRIVLKHGSAITAFEVRQ